MTKPDIDFEEDAKQGYTKDLGSLTLIIEKGKLDLAKWALLLISGLYLCSWILYIYNGLPGKEIFESAQKILPPFATLILGYYFARK